MTTTRDEIPEHIRAALCDLNARAVGATRAARQVLETADQLIVYNDDGWATAYLRELTHAASRLVAQAIAFQEAIGDRVQPDVPF